LAATSSWWTCPCHLTKRRIIQVEGKKKLDQMSDFLK